MRFGLSLNFPEIFDTSMLELEIPSEVLLVTLISHLPAATLSFAAVKISPSVGKIKLGFQPLLVLQLLLFT